MNIFRNFFRNQEDRGRQNNKKLIKKIYKKLDLWNSAYTKTIGVYVEYLVRLYKNLNHCSTEYESTLAKFEEVEKELRNFYLYYDKISYDHIDMHMYSNQDLFHPSPGDINTRLCFNESSEISFLSLSFLNDASKMLFDESEYGAYHFDGYCVEAKSEVSRSCRYNKILVEVERWKARNKNRALEMGVIRENLLRLDEEVEEYIRVVEDWKKRAEEVERRHEDYCRMRRRFRSRGKPAAFKHYSENNRPSFTILL